MNHALHRRALTMPRFDLAPVLDAIQKYRIDHLYIAPTMALTLAKHPLVRSYDLSSVTENVSAAAPLDAELAAAVEARLHATPPAGLRDDGVEPVYARDPCGPP